MSFDGKPCPFDENLFGGGWGGGAFMSIGEQLLFPLDKPLCPLMRNHYVF